VAISSDTFWQGSSNFKHNSLKYISQFNNNTLTVVVGSSARDGHTARFHQQNNLISNSSSPHYNIKTANSHVEKWDRKKPYSLRNGRQKPRLILMFSYWHRRLFLQKITAMLTLLCGEVWEQVYNLLEPATLALPSYEPRLFPFCRSDRFGK
jgi:hypothetical protein